MNDEDRDMDVATLDDQTEDDLATLEELGY